AEAVCNEVNDAAMDVLMGVASRVDKSLIEQSEQANGELRLMMLETLREYGQECLEMSGEAEVWQQAHAHYYLAIAEQAEPHLKGPQQMMWLRRLEQEQGNLRAALEWFIELGEAEYALHLCGALWWFWYMRGYWSEGQQWLRATLELPQALERTLARAQAIRGAGVLLSFESEAARFLLEESVAICRDLEDEKELADSLTYLGECIYEQDVMTARLLLEESVAICRKLGSRWMLSRALIGLGSLASFQGDEAQA